jgi:hypothetical protein
MSSLPRLNANVCRLVLGEEQLFELGFDFVVVREASGFFLRKDEAAVELNFEDTTGAGKYLNSARELFVVIVQHILRQTGGPLEIPSRGAIRYAHTRVLCRHHNHS